MNVCQSKTKSSIQIYKPKGAESLNCDVLVSSKVIIRSPQPVTGKIYFQLQARSVVVLSGHYNTMSNETHMNEANDLFEAKFELISAKKEELPNISFDHMTNGKTCDKDICIEDNVDQAAPLSNKVHEGVYNLTFRITSDMSPTANLLVFFTNDQEIILDYVEYKINKCFKNEVFSSIKLTFKLILLIEKLDILGKS